MVDINDGTKILKNKKNLFLNKCNFVKGVASIDGLEHSNIPEVAFLGRSNVGKSSLLNAITKRSKLAHTSKTPGRTQELNFFSFGEDIPILNIVDMPGYGFAKASKTIDKIKDRNKKISDTENSVKHHVAVHPIVHSTSSYKEIGLDEVRNEISSLVD